MSQGDEFNHGVEHETEEELAREAQEDRFLGLLVIVSTCVAITSTLVLLVYLFWVPT